MPSDQPPEPSNPESSNLEPSNPELANSEPSDPEPLVPPTDQEPIAEPIVTAEEVSDRNFEEVFEEISEEISEVVHEVTAELDPEGPRPRSPLPADFVDETLPETGLRLLKQALGGALENAQPIVKQATVTALRSTSAFLATTADRLEAGPLEAEPQIAIASKIASQEVAPEVDRVPATIQAEPSLAEPSLAESGLVEPVDKAAPSQPIVPEESIVQKLQSWWVSALSQVRARLPVSLNQKLGDRALTGAIAGVLVVLFWATSAVLPGKPQPPAVAIAPPAAQPAPSPQPVPPQVKAPASPQPVPVSPPPKPKPSPAPALQLSPEQKLIASIQDQVAEVSDRYSSSLIRSVQANFRSSRLVVKLGDSWYDLSETQQNKLSNELLKRAQQLDFVKLELSDPEGVLLARSPVVGTEMIILKRTTEAEVEAA